MWDCPETFYGQHGEVNPQGHCRFCGRKVAAKRQNPRSHPDDLPPNDELSYRYMWDPDFGEDSKDIWPV